MRFLLRAITTLRNLSCTLPESLQGKFLFSIAFNSVNLPLFTLYDALLAPLTWLCKGVIFWWSLLFSLKKYGADLRWITCSCSSWGSHWRGWTDKVCDRLIYYFNHFEFIMSSFYHGHLFVLISSELLMYLIIMSFQDRWGFGEG